MASRDTAQGLCTVHRTLQLAEESTSPQHGFFTHPAFGHTVIDDVSSAHHTLALASKKTLQMHDDGRVCSGLWVVSTVCRCQSVWKPIQNRLHNDLQPFQRTLLLLPRVIGLHVSVVPEFAYAAPPRLKLKHPSASSLVGLACQTCSLFAAMKSIVTSPKTLSSSALFLYQPYCTEMANAQCVKGILTMVHVVTEKPPYLLLSVGPNDDLLRIICIHTHKHCVAGTVDACGLLTISLSLPRNFFTHNIATAI